MTGLPPPIVLTRPDHERLSQLAAGAVDRLPEVGEFLADELERARVVESAAISPNVVTMNSHVEFRDEQTARVRTVTLVYPGEEDIAQGKISVLTPIGVALIGLSEGQSIEWETRNGDLKTLTVLKVHFQPEACGRFDL